LRTEKEIREHLKELEEIYAKASSTPADGKKPAHMVALARTVKDKIDILNWVLGEDKT
jgi:hypothetical protein